MTDKPAAIFTRSELARKRMIEELFPPKMLVFGPTKWGKGVPPITLNGEVIIPMPPLKREPHT